MFRNQVCVLTQVACFARPPHIRGYGVVQYDQDVVTWSPQGRIHQIEYAMEAVKQGSAAVGLKVHQSLSEAYAYPHRCVPQTQSCTSRFVSTCSPVAEIAYLYTLCVAVEQDTCCSSNSAAVARRAVFTPPQDVQG